MRLRHGHRVLERFCMEILGRRSQGKGERGHKGGRHTWGSGQPLCSNQYGSTPILNKQYGGTYESQQNHPQIQLENSKDDSPQQDPKAHHKQTGEDLSSNSLS
jgi:hypothetical protein